MDVPTCFFKQYVDEVAAGVGFVVVVGIGDGFILLLEGSDFGFEGFELLFGLLLPRGLPKASTKA